MRGLGSRLSATDREAFRERRVSEVPVRSSLFTAAISAMTASLPAASNSSEPVSSRTSLSST